jgi:hypothetical protein
VSSAAAIVLTICDDRNDSECSLIGFPQNSSYNACEKVTIMPRRCHSLVEHSSWTEVPENLAFFPNIGNLDKLLLLPYASFDLDAYLGRYTLIEP